MVVMNRDTKGVLNMTNKPDIIYKDIPGYEGMYKVSNFGEVVSCARTAFTGFGSSRRVIKIKEKILRPSNDSRGYLAVNLSKDGKVKLFGIHKLVMISFVGPRPHGMEIRHLNSVPTDNRLENLRYGTKSENMQDAVNLGTLVFSRSNLSREDVIGIASAEGSLRSIAKKFNTNEGTVLAIKKGKSFKNFRGDNVVYHPRKKTVLSESVFKDILDKNNRRDYLCKKYGLSINQIKRLRKTRINSVYIS